MTKTYLSRILESADKIAQYDAHAKRLVSHKAILAQILKNTADEVKNLEIEEIIGCIDDDIKIGTVPVNPGESNKSETIIGDNTESNIPYEGMLSYDIRFHLYVGSAEHEIKLLINVETQKNINQPYHIATRGIIYCARMISAQIDTEIINSQYQNLKKVYSIWICMNAPDYIGNALTKYSVKKEDIIGKITAKPEDYDKLAVILIYLNEKKDEGNNDIFHLLNVLLSPLKPVKEKEDILEKEFGIPIKQDYGEEVNQMCNLGEAIEEMGIAKGELKKLISLVRKKRDKGMNEAEIAEVLEEGQPLIHSIMQTLDEHEEDTDEQIAALFL